MARLDTSRPKLEPKMVRLAPEDWVRLEKYAARLGTNTAGLLRDIASDWLKWQDENDPLPDD